jgi:hypothetical protein
MATLQVKGMDDALYEALGARAVADNRSISQEVVMMIRHYLSCTAASPEEATSQFLSLCGSWEDERSAAAIAHSIRAARRSSKRFGRGKSVFD